jgi:pimeloyl-ACP methyl ester carboxylesterase
MTMLRRFVLLLLAVAVSTLGGAPIPIAQAAPAPARYSGTLPDGATWLADVPARWNGTLLLYSHGYNPGPANPAQDAPDPATAAALLDRGYALAGSSYSRVGWALATAAADQLATLAAVTRLIGSPRRVIAVGTSMGGLVTAQLAERARGRLDGALATCGLVAGGLALGNYQLDGLHALATLLLPGQPVRLVRFAGIEDVAATVQQLTTAIQQAQTTPAGRARIALAAAFFQLPGWAAGLPKPAPNDYEAQEAGQLAGLLGILFFTTAGRLDIEQTAGGNPSWNVGVDYRRLLAESATARQVQALYRQAGLDLRRDLAQLTRTADITADLPAVRWLTRTSTVSGELAVPVLTLHTTADPLVPNQHEEEYAETVSRAGDRALLRQAYVDRPGHCTFTTAELVAGVETVARRIETGRWGATTRPRALQALAASLGLGPADFVPFRPGEFIGDSRRTARPGGM